MNYGLSSAAGSRGGKANSDLDMSSGCFTSLGSLHVHICSKPCEGELDTCCTLGCMASYLQTAQGRTMCLKLFF